MFTIAFKVVSMVSMFLFLQTNRKVDKRLNSRAFASNLSSAFDDSRQDLKFYFSDTDRTANGERRRRETGEARGGNARNALPWRI